jgi:hypothetical protein
MFLLDLLDSLPRLRMSTSLFKMVLWLLKRCHVKNVPSLKRFRQTQTSMQSLCKVEPETFKSNVGNVFTINDPCRSIALVCACIRSPEKRSPVYAGAR